MSTTDDHERLREDLAGYVLGGLTPVEQHAVEAHLAECSACRAELAELDPVPVLLELAAPASAAGTEPDADAEPELVAVAAPAAAGAIAATSRRSTRRRSRTRSFLAGTAVAVAMAAAFTVGILIATPSEPGYGAPIALQAVGGSPASGTAAVRAGDHGTDVRLVLHHLPSTTGTWYECIWWSATGRRWSAGTFRPGTRPDTKVELLAAAALHPGWRLAILEHAGSAAPVTVLQTAT
jgi:hypothetical protein